MNVFVFDGVMGAGKTLGASIYAKYVQERTGCTLFSNFGLKGSKEFLHLKDFLKVADEKSSIIVLDESHMDLDSRNFNLNSVKFLTQIVFFLRKLRCSLFLTSPLFSNLDSRVQGVTAIYCPVAKDKNYFYYPFYDWQRKIYLKTKKINREQAINIAKNLYDTYAIVTPLEYPETRQEYLEFVTELKRKIAQKSLLKNSGKTDCAE